MGRDIESLQLQMSADIRRFEREMNRSREVTERRLNEIERAAQASSRRLSSIMEQNGVSAVKAFRDGLKGLAPALAGAFSAAAVMQYADAWTAGRNALAAAGVATSDLAARQNELVDVANRSRTGTADTIALFNRLSIATSELGLSQRDTMRLTELLNKSFQSSGASTQEAASAALQLSQALASGVLQGDELRALRESAPQLAQIIAQSMGVSIGALKQLGAEGKITSQVITTALFGAADQIEAKFDATSLTVAQSFQILNNQLGKFVGEADQGLSATQRMAQGIKLLADNLDLVMTSAGAVAAVIGTAFAANLGGKAVTAVKGAVSSFTVLNASIAVTNAQFAAAEARAGLMVGTLGRLSAGSMAAAGAMRTLNTGMAFFGGPIGAAITAVSVAIGAIAIASSNADQAVDKMRQSIEGTAGTARQAGLSVEDLGTKTQDAAGQSAAAAGAARDQAGAYETLRAKAIDAGKAIAFMTAQQREQAIIDTEKGLRGLGKQIRGNRDVGGRVVDMFTTDQHERLYAANRDLLKKLNPGFSYVYGGREGEDARIDKLLKDAEANMSKLPAETQALVKNMQAQRQVLTEMLADEKAAQEYLSALRAARGTPTLPTPTPTLKPGSKGGVQTGKADVGSQSKPDTPVRADQRLKARDDILAVLLDGDGPSIDTNAGMNGPAFKVMTKLQEHAQTASEMIGDAFEFAFVRAATGAENFGDVFIREIKAMAAELAASELSKFLFGSNGSGGLSSGFSFEDIFKGFGGSGGGSANYFDTSNLVSLEGGGHTGNGARSGGLDGKGGFLAMMHPKEIVTDLTKGLPSARALRSDGGQPQPVRVDVGITVDDDGKIQTYVRNHSIMAAQGGAQLALTKLASQRRRALV